MATKRVISLKDAMYTLLTPINRRYAPTIEKIRKISIPALFEPRTALYTATWYKARYPNDPNPVAQGPGIGVEEIGLAAFRIFDLINKTELKCFFKDSIEWYETYPTEGSRRLLYVLNLEASFREQLQRKAKKEMRALGIAEPTIETVMPYLEDSDPVNRASGFCAILLLSSLVSAGNKSLKWAPEVY